MTSERLTMTYVPEFNAVVIYSPGDRCVVHDKVFEAVQPVTEPFGINVNRYPEDGAYPRYWSDRTGVIKVCAALEVNLVEGA